MSKLVFKRTEFKYIITKEEFQRILPLLETKMHIDQYGLTTIQSLYYDNESFRLIRNSIDKPIYKEKLRLRSYGLNQNNQQVFLELKKKFKGEVYKRRIALKENEAEEFIETKKAGQNNQIAKEIEYFLSYYGNLKKSYLIIYDRYAYVQDQSELRVTFDFNIRYRLDELNLHTSLEGTPLEEMKDKVIMEIKGEDSIPLWLTKILSENKIYKNSFSKYGNCYMEEMMK